MSDIRADDSAATDSGLPTRAYSIDEFCRAYRISKATLFREWKRRRGPRTMKVGRRVLISLDAAVEWQRRKEAEAAA